MVAVGVEHLGGQRPVAGPRDKQMDVRRAPRVPAGGRQQRADGTVVRDRVRDRLDRADLVAAVAVGLVDTAQVELRCVRVLDRVQAVRRVLPDVERGPRQRLSGGVGDAPAQDRRRVAVVALDHRSAKRAARRARRVERAGQRPRGAPRGRARALDQARQPEDIRQQLALLAHVRRDLPDGRQEGDRLAALGAGQADLPCERVQVAHECKHQLAQARVRRLLEGCEHLLVEQVGVQSPSPAGRSPAHYLRRRQRRRSASAIPGSLTAFGMYLDASIAARIGSPGTTTRAPDRGPARPPGRPARP